MNLHNIVSGAIAAVNPFVDANLLISTGFDTDDAGHRTPKYATPGQYSGYIDTDGLLVVANIIKEGPLMVGMTLVSDVLFPGTVITGFVDGAGGEGTYTIAPTQTAADIELLQQGGAVIPNFPYFDFSTSFNVSAQVQPLSYKDIQQIDGMNLGGYRRAIYINGQIDALVRMNEKGGDLVVLADGTTWLVALVTESWPDWCHVVATLQNGPAGQA